MAKCGNCGDASASYAQIKACYASRYESGSASAPATTEAKATEAKATDYRPNKFAGVCCLCGARVEEGEGRIDRRETGSGWNVSHLSGECPERSARPEPSAPKVAVTLVPGGYYATESRTGNNDYDFWWVTEGTRNPSVRFVKRIIGGRSPERIHRSTALDALARIVAEGIDKCGDRFADELGRCRKCGKHLTDEESRAARMGPVCRRGGRD